MFQKEPISVGYFVASLVFLVMPSLLSMMFALIAGFSSGNIDSCSEAIDSMEISLIGVVMTITLPITAPILSGIDLFWKDMDDYFFQTVDAFKLFEILGWIFWAYFFRTFDWSIATNPKFSVLAQTSLILGESLPQLIISIVFIANNGGVELHPWNTTSAVFSAGSVMIGFITSVMIWVKAYKVMKK